MPGQATILHADLDAFFASVHQRNEPGLRGRPVIVGPGVVMAASYEARACGVRSAMGARKARRLCPEAVVVEPDFEAYLAASRAVFDVFHRAAPVVEKLSIDEAFIDARGLERITGSPRDVAVRLRADVRDEVGLALTVGVASTRGLAKVASGAAKPDGLLVVPAGGERAFLHPLPVERLWGVGPATAARLHAHGLARVGQVASLAEPELMAMLGRAAGRRVHALANYRDPSRVRAGRARRSFGSQSALYPPRRAAPELDRVLVAVVDRVTRRMRAKDRAGRTVVLRLRFADFTRATRSRTLLEPTAATRAVLSAARSLMAAARPVVETRGITLVGITVSGLVPAAAAQLELTLPGEGDSLDAVLDDVRERFGTSAVTRAAMLGSGPQLAPWEEADAETPGG